MARKLKGTAIQAGTITVTQLDSATSTVIQTGGGPKITNVQIANNSWTVLDDTAVDTAGGYLVITGTGFVTGALVYFNQTAASAVTFMSSTTLRVTVPALTAGTYVLYVINPDGGSAIRVPGVTASASPAWQTASALPDQYDGVVITLGLVATDAASYAVTSGSLPPGLSLAANTGVISGTVTGVSNDTTYTFTVTATDAQLQDSPRTFTVTITVSDPYFRLTTLLLGGEQGNTVVRDSSVNNFNLTVTGDACATNFTPYGTAWSVQFDGSGDYLSVADSISFSPGSSNFTIECWAYFNSVSGEKGLLSHFASGTPNAGYNIRLSTGNSPSGLRFVCSGSSDIVLQAAWTPVVGTWYHIAGVRDSNTLRVFVNGQQIGSTAIAISIGNPSADFVIGTTQTVASSDFNGYISNARLVNGTALYTANFTPATTSLTAVANTSLLTCHVNSFRDGSTNNFAITRNGDAAVRSFNPFNITNTGDSGSMYFDGTGDYLTIPNPGSTLTFGSNPFTIECWLYPLTSANAMYCCWIYGNSGDVIAINANTSTGVVTFRLRSINLNQTEITSSSGSAKIGQWNHLALVRNGTNFYGYVNGTRFSTTIAADAAFTEAQAQFFTQPRIGAKSNLDADYVNGYLSDWRALKGTALYTASNEAVPASPLTAITNTQLLTLQYRQPHNNHGFQDSSANQFLITRSGNATQGTFSPFSQTGWSAYFSGGYSSLAAGTTALAYGTGDFTIEFWIYYLGQNSNACVMFDQRSAGTDVAPLIYTYTGNVLYYAVGLTDRITGPVLTTNTWYHIAVSRINSSTRMFVDGTQVGSTYADSNSYVCPSGRPVCFQFGDGTGTARGLGYISNLRVIKNQGLYNGTFNTPLLQFSANSVGSTGSGAALSITGSTVLLTFQSNRFVDNSSTAATFTLGGTLPSVQAWSPFAPTAVYSPAVHGGSIYIPNNSSYLTNIGTTSSFNMLHQANAKFTIEAWVYPTASGVQNIFSTSDLWSKWTGFTFFLSSGAVGVGIERGVDGSVHLSAGSNTTITLNAWSHIAATVDLSLASNNCVIYINGQAAGTASKAANSPSTGNASFSATIGRRNDGTQTPLYNYTGYIGGLRIVVGTVAAPALPTTSFTQVPGTILLLNFNDAAILDRTGRAVLETVADAKSSSVQVKYGTGAMSFDGTGDYLITKSSDLFSFGTGDFTVEFWAYLTNSGNDNGPIFDTRSTSTNGLLIRQGNGGGGIANRIDAVITNTSTASSGTISFNTWIHVSVVRSSGTLKVYYNGTGGSGVTATGNLTGTNAYISAFYDNVALNVAGYFSDIRVTKGYARYTANFTPPTVAHRLK